MATSAAESSSVTATDGDLNIELVGLVDNMQPGDWVNKVLPATAF